jgi:hypothetical protein
MRQTQLDLPMTLLETRQARLDRIAVILNGPVSGKVHTADVYFTEQTVRRAEAIAEGDRMRCAMDERDERGASLRAAANHQRTFDANRTAKSSNAYATARADTSSRDSGYHSTV